MRKSWWGDTKTEIHTFGADAHLVLGVVLEETLDAATRKLLDRLSVMSSMGEGYMVR